ncbi:MULTISPECIES: HAD family hydrolase [Pseudonocardia]|uniref:Copper-exporting P-type ATPase A n=2 Tax=Pseudonocardia TaxID=1847 RepID=A0A1Y2N5P2_PSEAH|nr:MULTISPECIES: HAD family hydrolase [Pseudonocardia]OSY42479.1 Copper-exporting P-type ATPase A [Pseudonocardia autotrophica]TDN75998.1 Cu+-exporting ATPase [Pseudonocardia autotrophica]BBF99973.1 hypothetical protein Pdca_11830 [Pseudonocardia autotrophica]GEC25033.1 hypothetical protein PSA01_20620 [Pseudonocardia saturnea]
MRSRIPVALAAAVTALALPVAGPLLVPAPVVPALLAASVLLALAVVLVAGRAGHRGAAAALRAGTVSTDVGVSIATLGASAWAAPAVLAAAVSPAGPSAVLGGWGAGSTPADLLGLLGGPALLPGTAAVLTVLAVIVADTGRRTPPSAAGTDGPPVVRETAAHPRDALRAVADRWCTRLVPIAVLVALAVTGFRVGSGQGWPVAGLAGLAVLLAACPVVLLAAAPAAVRAADRAGGTDVRLPLPGPGPRQDPVGWTRPFGAHGVVQRIDTVALAGPDVLTGTGPGAIVVHPARGEDPDTVLQLAASVTAGCRPGSDLAPVARALSAAAGGPVPDVAEADEQPGLGVSGLVAELVPVDGMRPGVVTGRVRAGAGAAAAGPVSGEPVVALAEHDGRTHPGPGPATTVVAHAVLVGSPEWLHEHGVRLPPGLRAARERAVADGGSVVAVAWDGAARAVLTLDRVPHPSAAAGLDALRAAGAEPALLTPDDDGAARTLALAVGLDPDDPDAVRAGLGPAARAAAVAGLRARGRTVAVAADPGTDPDALAGADLAVALLPWRSVEPGAPGEPDPVPDPVAGSARIAARGGPTEVAAALVLARRARAHTRSAVVAAIVLAAAGTVAAAAGAPGPVVAALPVLGALAVRARRARTGVRSTPGEAPAAAMTDR